MARVKKQVTCKHCGQSNLYWQLDGSSWRMAGVDGKLHSCVEYRGRRMERGERSNAKQDSESNPITQSQQGEGQQQDGDTSNYQTQGQQDGQQQGEGQGKGEQQEQQQEGQNGQQDDEPDYAKDVKADKVFDRVKPQVEWTVAQSAESIQRKLDARFGRNEIALRDAVNSHMQAKLAEIQGPAPQIVIQLPDGSKLPEKVECSHPSFPLLLKLLALGFNVMLTGPAGTGKTTAAEQAAKALNLSFWPMSVGAQTSKTDIAGYQDAHSRLVRSGFREAFEHGGVFLLDEVDAGNANVLTLLNSALSNGYFMFPDIVIRKHESFRCVAAANTYGTGADRMYVGRNQLDAATLDRFKKVNWDYDLALEKRLGTDGFWLKYVWKLRKVQETLKIRAVFSTRAVIDGSKMLAAGIDRQTTEDVILWNGISKDDKEKLLENL